MTKILQNHKTRILKSTLLIFIFVALLGKSGWGQNIPCTGYNTDVVANGTGTSESSSNATVDAGANVFATSDFNPGSGICNTTNSWPVNVTSLVDPYPTYTLQAAGVNNSLRLTGGNSGTLTLTTPIACQSVYVLVTSGQGACNYTALVTFTDNSSQNFTGLSLPDWTDDNGANKATASLYRIGRNANTNCNGGENIAYMFQSTLNISSANQSKTIKSIHFTNNGSGNILNIFAIAKGPTVYCSSSAANGGDEDITNVTFGNSLNNTSACNSLVGTQGTATGTADMYSNFTSIAPTNVIAGITYPISVTITQCGGWNNSHNVKVYIDFNQNYILDDPGEVFEIWAPASSGSHTITQNITIPNSATLGNTRMRVICQEATITSPCQTASWGETEDYTINIEAATPMTYLSSTVSQASTADVSVCSNNEPIICLQVVTSGSLTPLSLNKIDLIMSGTAAITDVTKIHIYYTGNTNTFSPTNAFDGAGTTPAGGTINISGNQTLVPGTNYFWIAYDMNALAPLGNTVDAKLATNGITINATPYAPTIVDPAGSRTTVVCDPCMGSGEILNGGFEMPVVPANSYWTVLNGDPEIIWKTTASDDQIEIWNGTHTYSPPGFTYFEGNQCAEINANEAAGLYQDIVTIPCTQLTWSVAHRGRYGVDTMAVFIGPPNNVVLQQKCGTGESAWVEYTNTYNVPPGQFETRFEFRSIHSSNGNPSEGNFIDDVKFYCSGTAVILDINSASICSGSPVDLTLTATPAATFSWVATDNADVTGETTTVQTGNLIDDVLIISTPTAQTVTYIVTPTAIGTGCEGIPQEVIITVNPVPIVSATAVPSTICSGEPTSLTATGATTYEWNTGSSTNPLSVSPLATTTYSVTGTNGGCTDSTTVIVTVNQTPTVTATATSPTICVGSSTDLTADGANTYLWSTTETTNPISVSPATTTTYTVTGSSVENCTGTATVTVTVMPHLTLTAIPNPAAICEGSSSSIDVSGATSYEWDFGSTDNPLIVTPDATTTYSVSGSDVWGCTGSTTVTVSVNPMPTAMFEGDPLAGCDPTTVNFSDLSTGDIITWDWQFGDGEISDLPNPSHSYNAGSFTVALTVSTDAGCQSTQTMSNYVSILSNPIAAFTANPEIATEDDPTIQFIDQSTGATMYTWSFGDPAGGMSTAQNPIYSYNGTGEYNVTLWVENSAGCSDSTSRIVYVKPTITFYLPNAFSPNGDGQNDIYRPSGIGWNPDTYCMRIFNRWGNLVFQSTNINHGWDGYLPDNTPAQQGIYAVRVTITGSDHQNHEYFQGLMLMW